MINLPIPKVIRSRRSSISLQISRKGEFIVNAPILIPDFIIQKFIDSKMDWIEKTFAKVSAHIPIKKEFKEGEEFLFLGKHYKLSFHSGIDIIPREDKLFFPKALQFRIRKELENWYVKNAKEIIGKRVSLKAGEMQASYKSIMYSDTQSKWGTCTHDNRLQFNWRLIMAPLMVLDYVVIHELTHTTEKNHGRDFWNKVSVFTPAFRQHRKWLNEHQKLLMF
jgi:hypothetical protein